MGISRAGDATSGLQFRSVLVPHDFSEASDLALDCAAELASTGAGVVHLLHVLPYPPGSAVVDATSFVWADPSLLDARDAAAEKLLALGDRIDAPAEVHVAVGTPAAQICETAEHVQADLIVMAGQARRGVSMLLQGSIAARTVRRAPCPVFVVRSAAPPEAGRVPAPRVLN